MSTGSTRNRPGLKERGTDGAGLGKGQSWTLDLPQTHPVDTPFFSWQMVFRPEHPPKGVGPGQTHTNL